jgi:hypothetical protein
MAHLPTDLALRVVFLPWAPRGYPEADGSEGKKIAGPGKTTTPGGQSLVADVPLTASAGPKKLTPPWVRREPSIPDTDRVPGDPSALASVAVLLDVMTTHTSALGPEPTLLAELVDLLTDLAALGDQATTDHHQALLAAATSEIGARRALGARLLATSLTPDPLTAPSTPDTAAAALRRIEAMAQLVIHDVYLRLEAAEPTDYKQG